MDNHTEVDCSSLPPPGPDSGYIGKIITGSLALLTSIISLVVLFKLCHRGGFFILLLAVCLMDCGMSITGVLVTCIPSDPCRPYHNYALHIQSPWIVFHGFVAAGNWLMAITGIERIVMLLIKKIGFCSNVLVSLAFFFGACVIIVGHLLFCIYGEYPEMEVVNIAGAYLSISVYTPMGFIAVVVAVLSVVVSVKSNQRELSDLNREKSYLYLALGVASFVTQIGAIIFYMSFMHFGSRDNVSMLLNAETALRMMRTVHDVWLIILFTGVTAKFFTYLILGRLFRSVLIVCNDSPGTEANTNDDKDIQPEDYVELE